MRTNLKIFSFITLAFLLTLTSILVVFDFILDSSKANAFEEESYFTIITDENPINNKSYSRPLHINFRTHKISHQPISLGMNKKESDKIFKKPNKITCQNQNLIDFQDYISKCPGGTKVTIFEPNSTLTEHYGELKLQYILKDYEKNYYFSNKSEYGYVSCGKDKNDVFLRNIFNQSVASNTRQIEESLKNELNMNMTYKPLTVILFVVDSVSRRGFYRNMQETVEFFNESIAGNTSEISKHFYIYDFLGNNAMKANTRSNMTPFLFGISYKSSLEQDQGKSVKDKNFDDHYINRQKEKSIWTYFKQKGFITMYAHDVVTDYLPTVVGRTILADHKVCNFWNLAKQLYKYHDGSEKYKCIGSALPHNHSLNYLSQFLDNYKGYNKFAYIHISVAHDDSGTRMEHSDKDTKNFFMQTLDMYSKNEEDVFIIYASDHGRYNNDFGSLYGKGERSLPFHFVISNRDFIEKHSFHNNLDVNSRRLLSRYDWYKTLKHVANLPYKNITIESLEYQEIETEHKSISVLLERASKKRECSDVGIEESFCLSRTYQEILPTSISSDSLYAYFLDRIIVEMNNYFKEKISGDCKKVKIDEILYVGFMNSVSDDVIKPINMLEVFKLEKDANMIFMIESSMLDEKSYKKSKIKVFDNFEVLERKKESGEGKKAVYSMKKIWSLTRLDIISPYLKELNTTQCQESTFYNYNFLYAIKGKSCYETCKNNELICVDYRNLNYFTIFNKEKFSEIHYTGELNSLEMNNTRLIVGRYDMCDKNEISNLAICHCAQSK